MCGYLCKLKSQLNHAGERDLTSMFVQATMLQLLSYIPTRDTVTIETHEALAIIG